MTVEVKSADASAVNAVEKILSQAKRSVNPAEAEASRWPAGANLSSDAAALALVLDELDYGILVVDPAGRVVHANHAALSECAEGGVLRLADGRVHTRLDAGDRGFQTALAGAFDARRSLLSVAGPNGEVSVAFIPLQRAPDSNDTRTTLLILGRRQICEGLSIELFATANKLTFAEARVLKALCAGFGVNEAARRLGVAVSTLRTQAGSIRQKTRSKSLGELMRKVAALPPVVSSLRGAGARQWARLTQACGIDAPMQ